ncbi:hypothetical protein [Novosphingobium beihaiensis]|uniref:Uncharacterized protein n=1 Tax=Novosphingobium beihaiensis TaxID=2930389 RepID=A0ABT0BKF9_9SPHN|nr:hypothetical protein [Novosphingobium beihaiensis]MCJ2185453.1 hypothetical protein [Novosphingobium beihaiensis]
MQTFTKTLIGAAAAGSMAVSAATPALAREGNGGIGAGEVVAGALVIGGIAALAAASSDRDGTRYHVRYDRDHRRYGHRRHMNARDAVRRCTAAAVRTANRHSYGGRARVTDIRNVDRKRYGYKVEGRIVVNTRAHHWRSSDRDWRHDHRGWNRHARGYDSGKFKCKVDYRGRIADLDFRGIRGL